MWSYKCSRAETASLGLLKLVLDEIRSALQTIHSLTAWPKYAAGNKPMSTEPEEADYVTRVDVNLAILREIAKLRFKERLPRIMDGVAKRLMDAGVDFSNARMPEDLTITDEEWDAIYEDLR
jgi:hypothetical protein